MSDPKLHERVYTYYSHERIYTYYSPAKADSILDECQDKYIDMPEDGKVPAIS